MKKVFIDGSAGTTGLRIGERLAGRQDISLLTLPSELRKDAAARSEMLNEADIVFLCLPDEAAREAVTLVTDPDTVIIDTSTAHRTADGWVYGFPELRGLREQIALSRRIANPGCHASGFIALVAPLTEAGILSRKTTLSCFSLSGYSGGGKKMISLYEQTEKDPLLGAPRQYGLTQSHKHLPEMTRYTHLETAPAFCPVVADYYSGMEVTVPVFASALRGTVQDICAIYAERYAAGRIVHFDSRCDEDGFMSASVFAGRDDMQITVCGNDDRILLIARYDNLGKGASGAAIQNMNLVLGVDEDTGLCQ